MASLSWWEVCNFESNDRIINIDMGSILCVQYSLLHSDSL
jgi:hypothetical protein